MSSLIGKYKLINYTMFNSLNEELKWEGSQSGVLEYSKNGKVLVLINRTSNLPMYELSESDKKKLLINYVAEYKIRSEGEVSHKIISCNHSGRVGHVLHRSFKLSGDQLVIKGEGLSGTVELIWQRVSD